MKFISEAVKSNIIDDLVEAILGGDLPRSDIGTTISAFAEANEIGVYSKNDITDDVEVVLDAVSSLEDGLSFEEVTEKYQLDERMVKRVSIAKKKAGGKLMSRVKDKKTRSRRAVQNTGLSRSKIRKRARKAAKTLRRQKGSSKARKSQKLRKKSMKKRSQMGLD